MDKNKWKLAIVDDHNMFRKGLIKLIHASENGQQFEVLFEAANGADFKDRLLHTKPLPDIVVMDIVMPQVDGYEAAEWLHLNYPDIHILVLSMFGSEETIIKMLRLGVSGYLSKDNEVEDMNKALHAIATRGFYFSEHVAGIMAQNLLRDRDSLSAPHQKNRKPLNISDNEHKFLHHVCTDLTYQQIADQMHLSPKTIDGYRENLFLKFNVRSRVGLAMYAVKNNLVSI